MLKLATTTADITIPHERCRGSVAPGSSQLCPSRETFLAKIELPPGADLMQQLQACLLAFGTVLAAVHKFLVAHNLDDPTKV